MALFSDTFTDTGLTALTSHTPDVGTAWTLLGNSGSRTMRISTGGTDAQSNSSGTGFCLYYGTPATLSADVDVQATISNIASSTLDWNIFGRAQDADNLYFAAVYRSSASNDHRLYLRSGGSNTLLAQTDTGSTAGDVIMLRLAGTTIAMYVNGSSLLTATDGTISAAGKYGIGQGRNDNSVNAAFHHDSFSLVETGAITVTPSVVLANASVATPQAGEVPRFVVSVEKVEIDLTNSTTQWLNTADLSLGQNKAHCMLFATVRHNDNSGQSGTYGVMVDFDPSQPRRVRVQRDHSAEGFTCYVRVVCVEFDPTHVNVYKGTAAFGTTDGQTISASIGATVNTAKAFVVHSGMYYGSNTNAGQILPTAAAIASGGTAINFKRGHTADAFTTASLVWTVAEAINSEFTVQNALVQIASAATSGVSSAFNTIERAKTLLVGSYWSTATSDLRDFGLTCQLTGSGATVGTVTCTRANGGSNTCEAWVQVITFGGNEVTSDGTVTFDASGVYDVDETGLPFERSMAWHTLGIFPAYMPAQFQGSLHQGYTQAYFSGTNMELKRNVSVSGGQSSYNVVQWNLVGAVVPPVTSAFGAVLTPYAYRPGLYQTNWRWRNDDGDEASATWDAAEMVAVVPNYGDVRRLRLLINTGDDQAAQQMQLEFRLNGGSWTKVTTATAVKLVDSTYIAAGAATATTDQMTVPNGKTGSQYQAARISDDTNPLPSIDPTTDVYLEPEWCLQFNALGVFEFRVTNNGTPINGYDTLATASVSTFPQSVSGASSFAGAQTRRTGSLKVGAMSFTGTVTRILTYGRLLSGAMSFAGVQTRRIARSQVGAIAFAGANARQSTRVTAGTVTFAGALLRRGGRLVAGAVSFAGTLTPLRARLMTGIVSFAGALTAQKVTSAFVQTAAGTLTMSGALVKLTATHVGGAIEWVVSGAFGFFKFGRSPFGSPAIPSRTLSRTLVTGTLRGVSGSMDFFYRSAAFGRFLFGRSMFATNRGATKTLMMQTNKVLTGASSFAGALSTVLISTGKFLSAVGSMDFAGTLAMQYDKAIVGVMTVAGAVLKSSTRTMIGAVSVAGIAVRRAGKALTGAVGFVGTATGQITTVVKFQFMGASLSFAGVLTRAVRKGLAGALGWAGAVVRAFIPYGLAKWITMIRMVMTPPHFEAITTTSPQLMNVTRVGG